MPLRVGLFAARYSLGLRLAGLSPPIGGLLPSLMQKKALMASSHKCFFLAFLNVFVFIPILVQITFQM
jgi:hypothetical protein